MTANVDNVQHGTSANQSSQGRLLNELSADLYDKGRRRRQHITAVFYSSVITVESEVLSEPQGPMGRRCFPFPQPSAGRTPVEATRPRHMARRPTSRDVPVYEPVLLLVLKSTVRSQNSYRCSSDCRPETCLIATSNNFRRTRKPTYR